MPPSLNGSADGTHETRFQTVELALTQLSADRRGPVMARYGLLVIAIIATLGLIANLLMPSAYRKASLIFYGSELPAALALFGISFTRWFRLRWEAVVLFVGMLLLAAITLTSCITDNFRAATLGLLLFQMGAAAFFPWRPSHQFWFSAGTLASVAVFSAVTRHPNLELLSYWIALFAGSIIGQVACVSSYRYRTELGRRLESLIASRERLAAEVRKREKVIEELRKTQDELVVSREAALAASRARSEFLSAMSHEIRTPMNSVLGMAELMAETPLNTEQRRYLDLIQANGETLLQLINSILDLARMESGRLNLETGEFDLREMAEQLLDALAVAAFEKRLELIGRFHPAAPTRVLGDSFRLRQVLTNLIGNAIKFTERGQVLVTVAPDPKVPDAVRFTVADTGIGIPPDKLQMIFEPFTQADSSSARGYGGSGLGLAIAARLVAMMRGELTATSEPGKGSTFSFVVPLERAARGFDVMRPSLAGVSVLIADANKETRLTLDESVTALGARANQCASGADALRLLQDHADRSRQYGAILIDSRLPDLPLRELIARLSTSAIDLSRIVVMLRTTDLTGDLAAMRSAGLHRYVTKPVKIRDLEAACAAAAGIPCDQLAFVIQSTGAAPDRDETRKAARLLIADDVATNRMLVHDMLKGMPFEIDDAVDGQDALSKVMAADYDLVLMDMQMPVMDGYDAAVAVRKWERDHGCRHVPIVALTASALEADIRRAVDAGCDLHLAKPFRRKELLKLLQQATMT